MESLNKYQLDLIPIHHLIELRAQINEVLRGKRRAARPAARLRKLAKSESPLIPRGKIFDLNSSSALSIPGHSARLSRRNALYLPALLAQDWSHIYNGGDCERRYYVYAHVDPTKRTYYGPPEINGNMMGEPFYIGKGSGDRAYDLKRNQGHGKSIKRILDEGYKPDSIVRILAKDLTEAEAYAMEAKLIYFFGTIYSASKKKRGTLVNLDVPKTPEFAGVMHEYKRANPKKRLDQECADVN